MIESYNSYLDLDSAKALRRECDNILTHDPLEQKTWWYGFNRPPQNILENFIFQSARQHNVFHSYIGAEWWIRSHDSLDSSWIFHVDGDLGQSRRGDQYCAAPFSTITYLTDYGQPTVILDYMHDWMKKHFYIMGDNAWTFWSSPKMGKHINWSLPYFHGVPHNYGYLPEGEKRVTLMYNVWKTKPWEPECIEYNLKYKISGGEVKLIPEKDSDIQWLEPHGYFTTKLEDALDVAVQYHGYNKRGKSWIVTQYAPDGVDTTPRFPTQESH